jgi:hypothetical protein
VGEASCACGWELIDYLCSQEAKGVEGYRKKYKMRFTGLEITVYEADGSLSSQPTYEANSVKRAIEIIEATKALMTDGRTFTFRTF